jgi:hypothetical protein
MDDWQDVTRSGFGIEVTGDSDPERSYFIRIESCHGIRLESLVHFDQPIKDGKPNKTTNQTRIRDCESEGCRTMISGIGGNLRVRDCHIQLAEYGMDLVCNNGKFLDIDIERTPILYRLREGSWCNRFRTNSGSFIDESGENTLPVKKRKHKNRFWLLPTKHIAHRG